MNQSRSLVGQMTEILDELSKAPDVLADTRDFEVNCKHEFKTARRRALLSADRPKVSRDGWTVAERDAWVEQECHVQELAFDLATARRQAAFDHLATLKDQAMLVMAIAKARQSEMNLSGVSQT